MEVGGGGLHEALSLTANIYLVHLGDMASGGEKDARYPGVAIASRSVQWGVSILGKSYPSETQNTDG